MILATLNPAVVREARARHAAGETLTELAKRFGTSKPQMCNVLAGKTWITLQDERLCDECGEPGIEPSARGNARKMHIACARVRHNRTSHDSRRADPERWEKELAQQRERRAAERTERYAADPGYRDYVDARRTHSLEGRPYLEALSWRVIWTRYRLREIDFLRLLAWQQEACPCGRPFDSRPHVDHDHACCPSVARGQSCGKCVRGLLHSSCNHLLGIIEKNPDVIVPTGWVEKYLAEPPYQRMMALQPVDDGTLWSPELQAARAIAGVRLERSSSPIHPPAGFADIKAREQLTMW